MEEQKTEDPWLQIQDVSNVTIIEKETCLKRSVSQNKKLNSKQPKLIEQNPGYTIKHQK